MRGILVRSEVPAGPGRLVTRPGRHRHQGRALAGQCASQRREHVERGRPGADRQQMQFAPTHACQGMAVNGRRWTWALAPRDPGEEHRASTPLELLFDLCFVVAVGQAAAELHHSLAQGHLGHGLAGYASVFFAIWWAWMNFSWFASAYDRDDVLYRLLTLVQMAGVLVLATGVDGAFDGDFTRVTVGYVIMRIPLTLQWVRAAAGDLARRTVARRYAGGLVLTHWAGSCGWRCRTASVRRRSSSWWWPR